MMGPFQQAIEEIPDEDRAKFLTYWQATIGARVRSAYLTWSINNTTKQRDIERRERARVRRAMSNQDTQSQRLDDGVLPDGQ